MLCVPVSPYGELVTLICRKLAARHIRCTSAFTSYFHYNFIARRPFQNSTMSEGNLLDVMRAEDDQFENEFTSKKMGRSKK